MSGYRLCQEKQASRPYFVRVIGTNLYTAEELCFFFYHNPELLDDTIMEEGLCAWVRDELGFPEISRTMERAIREYQGLADFVLPIFRRIGYLTAAQLAAYKKTLNDLSRLSEHVRLKKKADALVRYGIEGGALPVYEEALAMTDPDTDFAASVWFNMGVANLYLFQYEEGSRCFEKANEIRPTKERNFARVASLALALPQGEREEALSKLEVPDAVKENVLAQIAQASSDAEVPKGDPEEWLAGLAAAYHKSMEL